MRRVAEVFRALCSVVLAFVWVVDTVEAQPKEESIEQLKAIASRTLEYGMSVGEWSRNSWIIVGLVVLVGSIGIVVSILQGFTTKSCKVACVILGATVSVATLISTTLFPADHRTYSYSAVKGAQALSELKLLDSGDLAALSDSVLQARVSKGLRLMKRMEALEASIYKNWATDSERLGSAIPEKGLISTAYAGPAVQGEVYRDKRGVRVSGTGESASLSQARETAITLAIDRGSEAVADEWQRLLQRPVEAYAVRPFIERVADLSGEEIREISGGLVRYRVELTIPLEFTNQRWSGSFGALPAARFLYAGDRVLLKFQSASRPGRPGVSSEPFSSRRDPAGSMKEAESYVTVVDGELRVSEAAARAMSFVLVRRDGLEGAEDVISSEDPILLRAGSKGGFVSAGVRGSVTAAAGAREALSFRILTSMLSAGQSKQRGLREGDRVELTSARGRLAAVGGRVVLGTDREREGESVLVMTRVARLSREFR